MKKAWLSEVKQTSFLQNLIKSFLYECALLPGHCTTQRVLSLFDYRAVFLGNISWKECPVSVIRKQGTNKKFFLKNLLNEAEPTYSAYTSELEFQTDP